MIHNRGVPIKNRLDNTNKQNSLIFKHIQDTNVHITKTENETSLAIRTETANAKLAEVKTDYISAINSDIAAISAATASESASNILQITATQTLNSAAEIIVIKAEVTAARQVILDEVAAQIAELNSLGTPATSGYQDTLYKIALGFPNAIDVSAAQTSYFNINVKARLAFPDAATVVHAEGYYQQRRVNMGLGLTTKVNIVGGHGSNIPIATAVLAGNSVNNVIVTHRGKGYISPPDVLFIGGGGTGTNAIATVKFEIIGLSILDTVTQPYKSIREIRFVGGGGTGAKASVILSNISGKIISYKILDPGRDYTSRPSVEFINGNHSTGVGATATAILGNGYVSGISVVNGGSGYTIPPTVVFTINSFDAHVTPVLDDSGTVIDFIIDSRGSHYTSTPNVVFNGGGTDAQAVAIRTLDQITGITLIKGGTGYNLNNPTNIQSGTTYTDFYTRSAFGYPNSLNAAIAQQTYLEDAQKLALGFPNEITVANAEESYINMNK